MITLTQEEMDAINYDAREGDVENLKEIFTEISPKLLLEIKDDNTLSTPIHMAAGNGHVETLEYLLSILDKKEAEELVNRKNESGNTALHWAAFNGHLPVIELLVEKFNADIFLKNENGHDAMFEAENNGKEEIEQWFVKKFSVEEDFKFEENEQESKITYTPGKETKEADERARLAQEASDLEKKTEKLSVE
ncbi:ankyrin repeat-containing protein Yar1p [[Candida] jaroonii]|uniref:Ankyrin repeat-containing protein Yar1p n=1 Tax=[Candida] jaroonii TaxID=467808 RepID=A0ACA9Y1T7_9ASCO|nr:ankyrin repeat-containing protein Yar1p [[Candida] jaroonii]